jgi:hypothetical protein
MEDREMQTVMANLAETFVADALDLVRGAARLIGTLCADAVDTARHALDAPVDRLARACDVAGMLPAAPPRRRFDPLGIRGAMRTLRDLS